MTATVDRVTGSPPDAVDVAGAASRPAAEVLAALAVGPDGLSAAEAARRLARSGPNAVRSHRTSGLAVLARQLRSPLLVLLVGAAAASYGLGERTDAVIIGVIVALSVGLGFANEYRAEKAAEALHDRVRHRCVVVRDGVPVSVDVTLLVPGDVVRLELGQVVPADLRLLEVTGLECDESVLTGESAPAEKSPAPVPAGSPLAELSSCALMGTVVHAGSGSGVVVCTGSATEFGRIAAGLAHPQAETEFQAGLRRFSMLLVRVAGVLSGGVFAVNLALHRPVIDALLFSLAIAVGITPQLLPAVVSTSLAIGAHRLARDKVLVKRLVCIEDLGDVDVLFTDKTGTLTAGHVTYMRSVPADPADPTEPLLLGLLCNEASVVDGRAAGGNPLDVALWDSPASAAVGDRVAGYRRLATLPFDHERRMASVLVRDPGGRRALVVKGAPEAVLAAAAEPPEHVRRALAAEFAAGSRVVAVATGPAPADDRITAGDERGLQLRGLLVFLDPPKPGARRALRRLARLGVHVKVVTGDNPVVAAKVCGDLGLSARRVLTGADLQELDDDALAAAVARTGVFARVSPEDKARIVRAQRRSGVDVAFLGDGVNDALALHAADVGISVDTATDVAKDAADVVLLEKDLDVLSDGVVGGRRIFANTMKYVLMGTSSNFGNMFSAAGASALLSFLPMLPSQVLLNNLLYDASQLAIPTDEVDEEQLLRPSRWDLPLIRRYMLFFGPISSAFDFLTFALMLWGFHAGTALFRSGWFVESLATQTLVIFAIRTRRVPFVRSRPSVPLLLSALAVVLVAAVLPASPLAADLGFRRLPADFFLALLGMTAAYLALVELGKSWFWRTAPLPARRRARGPHYRVRRRAGRFSSRAAVGPSGPTGPSARASHS